MYRDISSASAKTYILLLFLAMMLGCDNSKESDDPAQTQPIPTPNPGPVEPDPIVSDELQTLINGEVVDSISFEKNKRWIFQVNLPAKSTDFSVRTSAKRGSVTFYMKKDAYPSENEYDCLSTQDSSKVNEEQCFDKQPSAGVYNIIIKDDHEKVTLSVNWKINGEVLGLKGDYTVTALHTQSLLAVKAGTPRDGSNVVQYLKTKNVPTNQVWTFEPLQNGYYAITLKQSGLAITVANASNKNGANIQLNTLDYRDAQRFKLKQATLNSEARYIITNKNSSKSLTVANGSRDNGANVEQRSYNQKNNRHQQWAIVKYRPSLPVRKLVSVVDAWDVFKEAGKPYVGSRYKQDFTKHRIHPASPLDPRLVKPGTMIPGRVIVDGKPLVEYYPGTLPYIAVCVHNTVRPTQHMRDNYPVGWRQCSSNMPSHNRNGTPCNSLRESIDFRDGRRSVHTGDNGSGQLCQATVDYLEKITGQRPHLIIPRWPRGLIDLNRTPREKVLGVLPPLRQHPDIIATWDDAMSFVREARDIVYQQWGGGLQIGFHGQIATARNHFGSNVTASTVDVSKKVLNNPSSRQYKKVMKSSTFKFSLHQRKLPPWEVYKGQYSIGQGVAVRGIPTFPSATMKEQNGRFWSTGGAFERGSVSKNFQDKKIAGRPYPDHHPKHFDSLQLESYTFFLLGDRLKPYAAQLGEAIYDNLVKNMGFTILRIRGGVGAMTSAELSPITSVAKNCTGKPLASTTKGRVGSHFHLPQACLAFCRKTKGCKFVSMYVDPSPSNSKSNYKKNRKCYAYASCKLEDKSDFNVYRL